jgi:short subunit dehydrogenase-like uncharacterized protein
MAPDFLLYGATGFVGGEMARLATLSGLRPMIAGRDAAGIERLADEMGVAHRVFPLDDPGAIDRALETVPVVLHCAGPFRYTSNQIALAARDAEARAKGVMLLPGAGFDVVPTDCLALHLKQRLPSATRLTLAFQSEGPAGFPPGTQRTAIELIPFGDRVRRNGHLVVPERTPPSRMIDFGHGPVRATRLTWGDVFTAYWSTGIPNIEEYTVQPEAMRRQLTLAAYLRPLFRLAVVRNLVEHGVKPGPTHEECARTFTHVWGEVEDEQGRKAVARLHGPEAGVLWTTSAALAAVRNVLAGNAPPGYQTPATAYGADFVLECEGVAREEV